MSKNTHLIEGIVESASESESEGESLVEDEDEREVVEFDGNVENLLSIRHVLTAPRESTPAKWLRNNIFRTRCNCEGHACDVIIDTGACENMVSESVVSTLNLKTEKLSQPYKMAWFKKGNEVPITQRCLVRFSMGEHYHDEVWCDVAPMSACHILLGRPWQFDRKTIHDGRKNTYSFILRVIR